MRLLAAHHKQQDWLIDGRHDIADFKERCQTVIVDGQRHEEKEHEKFYILSPANKQLPCGAQQVKFLEFL